MSSNRTLTKTEIALLIDLLGGPAKAREYIANNTKPSNEAEILTSLCLKRSSKIFNKRDLIAALKEKSFLREFVSDKFIGQAILNKNFVQSRNDLNLKLVLITPLELGLGDGGFLKDIIRHAKNRGLAHCPMETAPYLLLKHDKDWVKGISVIVCSPHLIVDEQVVLFDVAGNRLRAVPCVTERHFEPTQLFIFRKV